MIDDLYQKSASFSKLKLFFSMCCIRLSCSAIPHDRAPLSYLYILYLLLCFCIADTTGEYSIYTEFKDAEIMFHVSTLLPYTASNKQQVCTNITLRT